MHPNSAHLLVPRFHLHPSYNKVSKQTKKKTKPLFLLLSCLSNTSLFVLMALEGFVCHIVYAFVPLPANVHCNESLVWFKADGFWYTIITEFLRPTEVTQATDIYEDSSCSWTIDSTWPLVAAWGWTTSWLWVQGLLRWPPDTTKVPGWSPNPVSLCDLWWQYRPQQG